MNIKKYENDEILRKEHKRRRFWHLYNYGAALYDHVINHI
jgi:hypothetical protein